MRNEKPFMWSSAARYFDGCWRRWFASGCFVTGRDSRAPGLLEPLA